MYVTVSVGNTDNKLTQQEWNRFVEDMIDYIGSAGKVHFFGGSSTWAPWQNVAWIVELKESAVVFATHIAEIRMKYKQESAFILVGEGAFI
jgi:hypothetical protein